MSPDVCFCGSTDVRLYGVGYRCGDHTPAKLAGLPELASADSTNVARNIGIDGNWASGVYMPATRETRALVLTERIESWQSPARLSETMTRQHLAAQDQLDLFGDAA